MQRLPLPGAFLVLFLAVFDAGAQPAEVPLWPGAAPGSEDKAAAGPEAVERNASGERRVANIHRPSLTPYLPAADKGTGASIIVIPGGGHRYLAIDHEGYAVAQWLADQGIAAFVLKYRLARETNSTYRIETHAFADIQRAVRTVRARATSGADALDPARIGVLGFSAGGELAAAISARFDPGDASAADPIGRMSSRPDFQALIYPGRSGDIQPVKGSPPVFLACAANDRPDISEGLAEVYLRFTRAGVPSELHIYASGGHGFGLRAANRNPVGEWPVHLREWLGERGFLKR